MIPAPGRAAAEPTTESSDAPTRPTPRNAAIVLCLAIVLLASVALGAAIGPVQYSAAETVQVFVSALTGSPWQGDSVTWTVVWEIRTPRVILAATVGAGLAVTGAVLQTLVRNPLADPHLLGVNAGAGCGAAASLLFFGGAASSVAASPLSKLSLPGSAMLGAAFASGALLLLARHTTVTRLLLAGVAVGYALNSVTSMLVFASDSPENTRSIMFWLLGSLGLAAWDHMLALAFGATLLGLILSVLFSRQLDALLLGDDTAHSLGVSPTKWRTIFVIGCCLIIGPVVAAAGTIGFVGLVVPHLARYLIGARHAPLLPTTALMGAILMVWADVLSRILLAPQEIPVGIITALLGAPFLILLLRRGARV